MTIPAFALPLDRAGAVEVIEDYVRAEAQLAAAPTAPLHLVNIGGGPAPDSLNALILLHKRHPGSLASRRTRIHVLDRDDQGPAFGVDLEHVRYDWADTAVLDRALREATSAGGMIACSAEGSLFDYGSDEEIVANLRSLHGGTPPGALVVGSVTRGGTAARRVRRASGIRVRPREWDGFVSLVQAAGWTVARVIETPVGYHVLLAKAGTAWTR
ncbi:MAG: hypothetical protein DMF78_14030 [Acidobacteria bacterium]|nr:MAG: hypothetical protein DMF78_14030 [Acidobacteriota bacterium]